MNKIEEAMARFICYSSNFAFGDTEIIRHFKPLNEFVDPFLESGVKLKTFKKMFTNPFPFIPTRYILIELQKTDFKPIKND